jgi:hypothetical protein
MTAKMTARQRSQLLLRIGRLRSTYSLKLILYWLNKISALTCRFSASSWSASVCLSAVRDSICDCFWRRFSVVARSRSSRSTCEGVAVTRLEICGRKGLEEKSCQLKKQRECMCACVISEKAQPPLFLQNKPESNRRIQAYNTRCVRCS